MPILPRIAALVPMRHESDRVRGKNYRALAGRPLFHHIVETLLACASISEVVIDTDSPLIMESAGRFFPEVRLIKRPEELRGGHVSMNDVLRHDVQSVDADLYVQTHSTNPLLRTRSVQGALDAFLAASDTYDSLFSVTPLRTRLWTESGLPINHDPLKLLRTQDLQPVMEENSCLYVFPSDLMRKTGLRIGKRPLLYPLDAREAWDIDEELDWLVAETLQASVEPRP